MVGSSSPRIHASPDGVCTGIRARAETVEHFDCLPCADSRPLGEPLRRRRAEDVEVAARQFEGCLRRVRSRAEARSTRWAAAHPPTGLQEFLSRRHSGGRSHALRAPALPRHTSSEPAPRNVCRRAARPSAFWRVLPPSGNLPSENTARSRAATTYTLYRGPHTCTSEGSSHVRRRGAFHPCMDRQERGSWHAVLKAGPRRTPQRTSPPWQPLIERSDAPSEREDLRPRDSQPPPVHVPAT